jgi:hypothetical protein
MAWRASSIVPVDRIVRLPDEDAERAGCPKAALRFQVVHVGEVLRDKGLDGCSIWMVGELITHARNDGH